MKIISKKDEEFIRQSFQETKMPDYSINHAFKTARYFKKTAEKFSEISKQKLYKLTLASLGHDLLEDTKVTRKQIKAIWGTRVLDYIQALTNEKGDNNYKPYIKRLKNSSEEIVLIKLADIYTNVDNSIKHFDNFEKKWINNFWLPLLAAYERALFNKKFKKYSQTASLMVKQIKSKIINLQKLFNQNK